MTTSNTLDSTPVRLIKKDEVLKRVPFSHNGLYRAIRAGEFPKPIRIGARAVAWSERAVNSWIEERIAASRN